jgi:subtilisin family serine protease
MKKYFLLFLVVILFNNQVFTQIQIKNINYKGEQAKIVSNEICIKLKPGYSTSSARSIANAFNGFIKEPVDVIRWTTIRFPNNVNVENIINGISNNPIIETAEFNFVGEVHAVPNDSLFGQQWGLRNTGQSGGTSGADINTVNAWNYTTGSSNVVLAILDSGIPMNKSNYTLSHPDLDNPSKIIIGPDVTADGDSVSDSLGHGTHVAGIAGAESNNVSGISGVCWDCKLLIVQVIHIVGTTSKITTAEFFKNGVVWVINWENNNPTYKVVINYSAGIKIYTKQMEDAVVYASENGISLITTMGNDESRKSYYPARFSLNYSNVIAVGSTTNTDNRAGYSGTGPHINIMAPGGSDLSTNSYNIVSTRPNYHNQSYSQNYGYQGGTSMAAPHVTGLVGLILSLEYYEPNLLREIIQNNTNRANPTPYFDTLYGWGRIDAYKALSSVNIRPLNCTVTNDNNRPKVTWERNNNLHPVYDSSYFNKYLVYKGTRNNENVVYEMIATLDTNIYSYTDMSEYIYPSGQGENNKKIRYRISSAYLTESTIDYETAKSNYAQINVKGGAVEKSSIGLSKFEYSLSQNFPNPFNPSTVISYQLSAVSYVTLKVFDILGKEIETLVDEVLEPGIRHSTFHIPHSAFTSGVYFYQLRVGSFVETKKMILMK